MKHQRVISLAMGICFIFHTLVHSVWAQEFDMSLQADSVRTVISFETSKSADQWIAINDNVMGGVSNGGAAITEDSCLLFTGSLSLENNGGFASIRTRPSDFDLSGFTGIQIRIKGDGRVYQFRLRIDHDMDGVAYKHEFQTVANTWIEIDMPFDSFLPSYRGNILRDAESLIASDIRQMGFMISDRVEGAFSLLVSGITAYR